MITAIRISLVALALLLAYPDHAQAGMSFGLSGGYGSAHLGLQTHTTKAGKASLSVDLGSYFRIGYSYNLTLQDREGYVDKAEEGEEEDLVYFEQNVIQNTHSVDVFAVLYGGEVLTPFIFVGLAIKSYRITYQEEGEAADEDDIPPFPAPNYGAGLAININRSFALKVTNTWSVGVTEEPGGEQKRVPDSQLDVGISYKLE